VQITSCLSREVLQRLLESTMTSRETQSYETHLSSCGDCRRALEALAGEERWWVEASEHLSTRLPTGPDWNETSDTERKEPDLDAVGRASLIWQEEKQATFGAERDAKALALQSVRQWLEPGHPELLGKLADYDIESVIGQGGFGVVLRAFDRELNRPVAIKVLAPHLATVGAARRRFIREAQAAAAVVHPNVVPIHAVQAEADYPFLVMTFVPGGSLQQCVTRTGPLEAKVIVRIAQQVAAGLAAAHRQGLVHRDIKPGNILLENGLNRALITDFGLARAADDAATQTGWLAGTPHYMSPEQAAGESLDGRSDLFSLGSVMYFMATAREPFSGDKPLAILHQILHKRPPAIRSINSDIPEALAGIIERLLQKQPSDRFQTAGQLSDWLEQYLAHLQHPEVSVQPKLPQSVKVRIGSGLKLALSVTAGFIMTVLAWVWWSDTALQKSFDQLLKASPLPIETPSRQKPASEAAGQSAGPNPSPASAPNDDASRPAPTDPQGEFWAVDDPRFQRWIEWQRAEATWILEERYFESELKATTERLEAIERANEQAASRAANLRAEWYRPPDPPIPTWQNSVDAIDEQMRALENESPNESP
jgi:serine/threonine protein kinase